MNLTLFSYSTGSLSTAIHNRPSFRAASDALVLLVDQYPAATMRRVRLRGLKGVVVAARSLHPQPRSTFLFKAWSTFGPPAYMIIDGTVCAQLSCTAHAPASGFCSAFSQALTIV
jgi:hypothetical protein